jgi:hypothetical protein
MILSVWSHDHSSCSLSLTGHMTSFSPNTYLGFCIVLKNHSVRPSIYCEELSKIFQILLSYYGTLRFKEKF